jgi:hypothetical protein
MIYGILVQLCLQVNFIGVTFTIDAASTAFTGFLILI